MKIRFCSNACGGLACQGLAALAFVLVIWPPAISQDTATAEIRLRLNVENEVSLRRVQGSVRFEQEADGTFVAREPFCVSASLGHYAFSVSGDGADGAFELTSRDDYAVPYSIRFVNDFGGSAPILLDSGQSVDGVTAPNRCRGTDTVELEFVVLPEDIPSGGRYDGRATILIAGE